MICFCINEFWSEIGNNSVYRNECIQSTRQKIPEVTTTPCSKQNHMNANGTTRSQNPDAEENETSRGVKKQKYSLDDYLINQNMQTLSGGSLLSPISPVSSPETVDVLQNAERLLKNAQRQLMEVSVNSTREPLNENLPSYLKQQHLDDGLSYIRDIVKAKFQDTNEPDTIPNQKTLTSNVHGSNRKLQPGRFQIRESSNILNKPLEISEQSSQFLSNQIPKKTLSTNERPFLQKAPHWFQKQIHVFPTSTTCNEKSNTKSSPAASCCAVANTGVFEVNSKTPPNKSIKVQTGPTVEIRGGLTIQNIENIHISPDPSMVPVHNNIAMYCFQHEPLASSSINDSNENQPSKSSIMASNGKKHCIVDGEKHIQSTNYIDEQKVQQVENTNHYIQYNTVATHVIPANNNSNNYDKNKHSVKYDENATSILKNRVSIDSSVNHHPIIHKTIMDNQKLHELKISLGSPEDTRDNSHSKKKVSINSDPIEPTLESVSTRDLEVQMANEREEIENTEITQNYQEFPSNLDSASSYHNQKFHLVQSDKDYVQRSKACKDECRTGSCSRKCERDVEHTEKQKLTDALQAIVNIQKLRYDMKDTGVVPSQCTQMCDDRNECVADTKHLNFQPISEPDQFKRLLERLCKSSPKTGASEIDTNSEIFKEAMDDFVKIFFEISGNSRYPVSNVDNHDTISIQNGQAIRIEERTDKIKIMTKAEKVAKASKQANLFPKLNQMEYRRGSEVKPKMGGNRIDGLPVTQNNASTSHAWRSPIERAREPNKYPKRPATDNAQLPKQKFAHNQREKSHSKNNYQEQQNNLMNLNLEQPCVSEVDAISKIYQESMAAIWQGTEQLSQLISHHVMKNASSTADQIASLPIPGTKKKFISCSSIKSPEQSVKSCANRMQVTEVEQQKHKVIRTPRSETFPVRLRNDAELSNEDNSVCIDEVSTSVTDIDDTSNAITMSQIDEPNSANMKPKCPMLQQRVAKPTRKPDGMQFMDVHYCITEPLGIQIPIGVKSDKNTSSSNLKSSMNMHLQLENASGENTRLCQRPNANMYGDQTVDLRFYESQVFTPGYKYNFDSSNNCPSEKVTAEPVLENKRVEFQGLGEIFDAMKRSSHLLKQLAVLLANGMKIDSVDDFVRSLEVAAIHPIVIDKFLSTLREKSKENSVLGKNVVMTQETDNGHKDSATLHPAGDYINNKINSKDQIMNMNLKFSDDCTHLMNHTNSQGDKVPENRSKSDLVAPDKDIGKVYLENSHDNFDISKPAFQDKISLSTSSLLSPLGNLLVQSSENEEQVSVAQRIISADDGRVRKESSKSENPRHVNTILNEQSNVNMGLQNSSFGYMINEKNEGDSNTDQNSNFSIPLDVHMNDKVPEIPITNKTVIDAIKSQQQKDQVPKNSTPEKTNLIESPDHSNRTLGCEHINSIEQDTLKIEVNDVLFQSSLDTGSDTGIATVHSPLQDNNKPSRGEHSQEGAVHCNCNKMQIPPSKTILITGESSLKSNSTSQSHERKAAKTSRASEKKKKPYQRRDANQNSSKVVAGTANRDFEKSSSKNMCPLCIRFHGICSCLNCSNCMVNFRKYQEVSSIIKVTKAKLPKSIAVTSHQVGSVKRLAQKSNDKSMNSRQGMPRIIKNSTNPLAGKKCSPITQKSKSKRNSASTSNGTFNSIQLLKSENRPEDCQKFSQGTIPELECSIMKDESQNTTKCVGKTVSTNTETIWQEATILADTSQLLIGTLEKIVNMKKFDNPAKETQVLKCSDKPSMINKTHNDHVDCQSQITSTTNIKEFTSMECQTLQSCSVLQERYKNSLKAIPVEVEMDSTSVEKSLEIFENQSILVLQPLSELDHTYFIAKPNFEERKLIKERLNANFNISNKEVTKYNESCNETSKKLTNSDDPSQLNVSLPADNHINNKECQVICSDVEDMANSTDKKQSAVIFACQHTTDSNPGSNNKKEPQEGHDSCSNDDECLICLQSSSESDNSQFPCSQDCLDEEMCSKVCAAITDFDETLQFGSINIDGILRKFLAENNASSVKLPILKALIQELEKVTYSQNVDRDRHQILHETSKHDSNQNDTEVRNAVELAQAAEPRFNEDRTRASSVQYGESHEKMLLIMKNRRSLMMPNVVRGLADVHPSKNLERLILHSTDPLVSGTFNKPESETRYSVFNKSDSEHTSFNFKDPKIQEHLTSVAQAAIQQIDMKPLEISADNVQSVAIKKAKKSTIAEKSMNNVSKSKKNEHGMQADSGASAESHSLEVAQGTKDDTRNHKIENLQKYSDKDLNDTEFSNRPQIIEHFLGKIRLEDMKIQNININKNDCTHLTPITTIDLENIGIGKRLDHSVSQVDMQKYFASSMPGIPRTNLTNFNQSASKYLDQTSCDTLSEGEINLPSSCSRSLGEVRITTSSCSTTVEKSYRDPDGFTVIVTKSVLDSTLATCTSPGEILAEINGEDTDFSSIP